MAEQKESHRVTLENLLFFGKIVRKFDRILYQPKWKSVAFTSELL